VDCKNNNDIPELEDCENIIIDENNHYITSFGKTSHEVIVINEEAYIRIFKDNKFITKLLAREIYKNFNEVSSIATITSDDSDIKLINNDDIDNNEDIEDSNLIYLDYNKNNLSIGNLRMVGLEEFNSWVSDYKKKIRDIAHNKKRKKNKIPLGKNRICKYCEKEIHRNNIKQHEIKCSRDKKED
jgi:hypothetical protein